jgi:enediyne biosynthesis protein E4
MDDAVIGRAFRWSLGAAVAIALIVGVAVVVYNWPQPDVELIVPREVGHVAALDQRADEMPAVRFIDITSEAGIDFVHFDGATGEKMLPETMGGGVAFFDSNNSGHPDLLFVNGTHWPWDKEGTPALRAGSPGPRGPENRATMKLYRNDGRGNFEDVTAEAGLDAAFYGMGVAVGDYNNNGHVDVFITAVGPNHLYRNEGGRFIDVTAKAGVAGAENEWSTSAGFFDADNNGLLDLFVCNYIQWSREIDIELNFTLNGRDRAYGPPTNYRGAHSYLYRNNGDETFTDVSETAGIQINNPATGLPLSKALALAFADVDGSGYLDIFVANDTTQNFLFHNQAPHGRDFTFREIGSRAGVAFDGNGAATGAMGIDAAYYRNDDALAVGIGNFANEMTSFYVSRGSSSVLFSDDAIVEGIGSPTRVMLTFGLFFFDYDLDGRLDMFQTNGHIEDAINEVQASQHYRQPAQLFWNARPDRRSCYVEVPSETLGDLNQPIVGRGAAYADIDGDGDLDIILTQIAGPPMLLRNDPQTGHNWLRVRLVGDGATVNRDAIGATVELTAGGVTQRRMVMPTKSYLSQVELPVTFGLGELEHVDSLRIIWPGSGGGLHQTVPVERINTTLVIVFGPET